MVFIYRQRQWSHLTHNTRCFTHSETQYRTMQVISVVWGLPIPQASTYVNLSQWFTCLKSFWCCYSSGEIDPCSPLSARNSGMKTDMINVFPQLSHFLKTDESYCYPSSSQWEWHVPTNQTFAPINCMMEDRFISRDFPAINVPMQQMSIPSFQRIWLKSYFL